MKLHHLKPAPGSRKKKTRVGRGEAAGKGKTAGRGTKGLKARRQSRIGFEGGQMPLMRRVPKKKGFTNPNRREWAVINVELLAEAFGKGGTADPAEMRDKGLVRKGMPVKVLARGDLDAAITVKAQAFSAAAKAKIEQAGGTAEVVPE
jgi:large subunit ribosomal protein L15